MVMKFWVPMGAACHGGPERGGTRLQPRMVTLYLTEWSLKCLIIIHIAVVHI